MEENKKSVKQNKVFANNDAKNLFQKGIKYLALALPLLFGAPILVTIGFKALNKGDGYLMLILGCILFVFTIALVTQAFRLILKALFQK